MRQTILARGLGDIRFMDNGSNIIESQRRDPTATELGCGIREYPITPKPRDWSASREQGKTMVSEFKSIAYICAGIVFDRMAKCG